MKKHMILSSVLAALLLLAASLPECVYAGPGEAAGGYTAGQPEAGGYTGPGPALVKVKDALDLGDDVQVSLRGKIVRQIGHDKYVFADDSGEATVEIKRKAWRGQTIGPDDLVEILGKVDKKWNKTEIDVKRLRTAR